MKILITGGASGLGESITRRLASRITSYNVCYTKLLRYLHLAEKGIAVTILANRKQCEQKTPYNDGPLQVVPVPFPDVFFSRITSYNVCYTKLLRDSRPMESAAARVDRRPEGWGKCGPPKPILLRSGVDSR